jgi:hypothetical protein
VTLSRRPIAAGRVSHSGVLPSMSVNRKVSVRGDVAETIVKHRLGGYRAILPQVRGQRKLGYRPHASAESLQTE